MAASRGDVREAMDLLARFDPVGRRSLIVISLESVLTGMLEASVLVVITSVAVSLTKPGKGVHLGPIHGSNREILLLALLLLALNLLVGLVLARSTARLTSDASFEARRQLLEAFHAASYQRKSQDRVASLQEALTTYVDRLGIGFNSLAVFITALFNLLTFAVAAIVVNPFAAGAIAVLGVLVMLVLRPATARTRAAVKQLVGVRLVYTQGATESVLLAREEAVFGVTEVAGERLQTVDELVKAQFYRTRFLGNITPRAYQSVAFLLALIGLLGLTALESQDLAAIGAVVLLLVRSLSYGQQVLTNSQFLSEQIGFMRKLVETLDTYHAEPRHRGTTPIGPIETFHLDGVSFAYPGARNALTDITLDIKPGEAIGVLGPSGAGKTTLVNLLLRLYEPSSGTIAVNGVPLREALDEEWFLRTAIVPQEPRLIHGTVADNIRFLREISDDDVRQAAVAAHIAPFVESLPDQYESHVGELGAGMSGGQRQRICIARALAGNPDLLVLDEPTSALDGESEDAIQRTLVDLKGKVTMVIVAHRLSTLTICDRLAVMKDGKLVGLGTSEELEESSTYYREALRLAGL